MKPDHEILNPSEWSKAHKLVSVWRNDPGPQYSCPRCDAPGISVVDNSNRPYAEWYELTCPSCKLEVTMHLPLAPPPGPPV